MQHLLDQGRLRKIKPIALCLPLLFEGGLFLFLFSSLKNIKRFSVKKKAVIKGRIENLQNVLNDETYQLPDCHMLIDA